MNEKKCKVLAAEIRLETLKVIHSRGFGHVGGSMDLADLMAVLYGEVMRYDPKNPRWEDRDWLVLSKGHAGPVAYATFGLMGFYPMEEAYTLNQPGTKFPSHTDRKHGLPGPGRFHGYRRGAGQPDRWTGQLRVLRGRRRRGGRGPGLGGLPLRLCP